MNDSSNTPAPTLKVVMYHYVRDLPNSRYPQIKGMLTDDFRRQVAGLKQSHELVDCEGALQFVRGEFTPRRPPCLLTFDDGLKDHYTDVLPILAEARASGVFFLTTVCQEEHRVVSVHKNHVLLAELGIAEYQRRFQQAYESRGPWPTAKPEDMARTYRWDTPEVAAFKYAFNFQLPHGPRDAALDELFVDVVGDEGAFARTWYLDWREAREMQAAGLAMGGHTHRHAPLTSLPVDERRADLETCGDLLHRRLSPQTVWPFSYPYGKSDSFDAATVDILRDLKFDVAFTTEVGDNGAGADVYRLRRIDTKDVGL